MAPSKVKNENPDDFATYLAKRKAAESGQVWKPGSPAPAPVAAGVSTTTLNLHKTHDASMALPNNAVVKEKSSTSKVKNENPDDFPTYMAKRKAAAAGVV